MRRFEQEKEKRRRFGVSSLCPSSLLLFLLISLPLAAGCSTHQCDARTTRASAGAIVAGTNVWQSSPPDRDWIEYDGNETLVFSLPSGFPSEYSLQAWVSTAPDQTEAGGGQFVEAAGQLAEFQLTPDGFTVFNDTCAAYFIRVVATPIAPAPVDAGGDAPHD